MSTNDKKKIIVDAALELFAEKGLSNVGMNDISERSGIPLDDILAHYEIPGDILYEAFKKGQRKMEEIFREPVMGNMDNYMEVMFDGLEAAVSPWGPELYFNALYQATKDKVLKDAFSRSSRNMGFAVKSFLAQMVAMSIVDEIENVEKVNNDLVTSFIENMASCLEGTSISDVKSKWVENASKMLSQSSSTHVE